VNSTDDLVWQLQDDVQRLSLMVRALCRAQGIDPDEAGRLPDDVVTAPS
jgi:hypothetical protein